MRKLLFTIIFLWSMVLPVYAQDERVQYDFYCGCAFTYVKLGNRKAPVIDHNLCSFVSETNIPITIEQEHVMPVAVFARGLECWEKPVCTDKKGKKYRGRRCCLKTDPFFKKMYSDKKNLRPVIGELNRARRDYPYARMTKYTKDNNCYLSVNKKEKVAEAAHKIEFEIINIYEYMNKTYSLDIQIPFNE